MIDNNHLPAGDLTQSAVLLEPNAPKLYNADGTLNWAPNGAGRSTWTNPLAPLQNNYKNTTSNLISNLNINIKLLPGLELRTNAGYTILQSDVLQTFPLTAIKPERRPTRMRQAQYSNSNINTWIMEPQINYMHNVLGGTLDLLLGATLQQNNSTMHALIGTGFNDDESMSNINAAAQLTSNTATLTKYKYGAVFGRLNYNWHNKYILNLTSRRDGSSRFGPSTRFHYFASAGAAWIFSEEKWVKESLSFLSFGKLRASYGTTGSDQIPDYSYLDLYDFISVYNGLPYQGIRGLISNRLFNPYLQWEETRKVQTGIELGLFKDRVLLSLAYQRNRSSNQLLSHNLPIITGFTNIISNFPATIQNTSFEGNLETRIYKNRHFEWTANINFTIPRNKLVSFPGIESSAYATTYVIGQPVSIIKVFKSQGVDLATGKYSYIDKQGKSTSDPVCPDDLISSIVTLPRYYGGVQQTISYRGLQLDLLFQFIKQTGINNFKINNGSSTYPGQFFAGFSNQPTSVISRWQKQGDQKPIAVYTTQPDLSYYNISSSDYLYEDASYIRLKNISFSWQLPTFWCQSAHLQNIRIYLQAQNLWTITKYKGIDPESQGTTSLPPLKIITTGLQISL
jgi:TonB-linked SusC/RagA family outer membrane protein